MTTPSDWIAAALENIAAAVAPVIVGAAEATRQGQFDWWPVFICLSFALLVQIATNMANDYFVISVERIRLTGLARSVSLLAVEFLRL